MSRTYNLIDADGHVLEPPDFWQDYMDPAYRAVPRGSSSIPMGKSGCV